MKVEGRVQGEKAAKYQNRMKHSSGFQLRMGQNPFKTLIENIDLLTNFPTPSPTTKYTQAYPIRILQEFKRVQKHPETHPWN